MRLSDEDRTLIRLAYGSRDPQLRRRVVSHLRSAVPGATQPEITQQVEYDQKRKYQKFLKEVGGKKFRNPDTGNQVLYVSLPQAEQTKIYQQWQARYSDESKQQRDQETQLRDAYKVEGNLSVDERQKRERETAEERGVVDEAEGMAAYLDELAVERRKEQYGPNPQSYEGAGFKGPGVEFESWMRQGMWPKVEAVLREMPASTDDLQSSAGRHGAGADVRDMFAEARKRMEKATPDEKKEKVKGHKEKREKERRKQQEWLRQQEQSWGRSARLSDEDRTLIRLAHSSKDSKLRRRVVSMLSRKALLVRLAAYPKEFMQEVENQKFTNPETKNEVLFVSLPPIEQARIYHQWKQDKYSDDIADVAQAKPSDEQLSDARDSIYERMPERVYSLDEAIAAHEEGRPWRVTAVAGGKQGGFKFWEIRGDGDKIEVRWGPSIGWRQSKEFKGDVKAAFKKLKQKVNKGYDTGIGPNWSMAVSGGPMGLSADKIWGDLEKKYGGDPQQMAGAVKAALTQLSQLDGWAPGEWQSLHDAYDGLVEKYKSYQTGQEPKTQEKPEKKPKKTPPKPLGPKKKLPGSKPWAMAGGGSTMQTDKGYKGQNYLGETQEFATREQAEEFAQEGKAEAMKKRQEALEQKKKEQEATKKKLEKLKEKKKDEFDDALSTIAQDWGETGLSDIEALGKEYYGDEWGPDKAAEMLESVSSYLSEKSDDYAHDDDEYSDSLKEQAEEAQAEADKKKKKPKPKPKKKPKKKAPTGKHKDRKELRAKPTKKMSDKATVSDELSSLIVGGLPADKAAKVQQQLQGASYELLSRLRDNAQAALDDPDGKYAKNLVKAGYTPGGIKDMHASLSKALTPALGRKYHPEVLSMANQHDLESEDADELAEFKVDKPQKGKKLSPQELFNKFLAKAKPETRERMQGMPLADFMVMYKSIMSEDEEGEDMGKTAEEERLPQEPHTVMQDAREEGIIAGDDDDVDREDQAVVEALDDQMADTVTIFDDPESVEKKASLSKEDRALIRLAHGARDPALRRRVVEMLRHRI